MNFALICLDRMVTDWLVFWKNKVPHQRLGGNLTRQVCSLFQDIVMKMCVWRAPFSWSRNTLKFLYSVFWKSRFWPAPKRWSRYTTLAFKWLKTGLIAWWSVIQRASWMWNILNLSILYIKVEFEFFRYQREILSVLF